MALTRIKFFEKYFAQDTRTVSTVDELIKALETSFKCIGEEMDRVMKNIGGSPSPETASGGTVVLVQAGGTATTGIIANISQSVVAGSNYIPFGTALSSATYGGFLFLSDADGMIIESVELRTKATLMTTAGFYYDAPQAGTLSGFALVNV